MSVVSQLMLNFTIYNQIIASNLFINLPHGLASPGKSLKKYIYNSYI